MNLSFRDGCLASGGLLTVVSVRWAVVAMHSAATPGPVQRDKHEQRDDQDPVAQKKLGHGDLLLPATIVEVAALAGIRPGYGIVRVADYGISQSLRM